MKTPIRLCVLLPLLIAGLSVRGDILELKNGSVLNGKYTGGTAATLRFETSAGLQVIETSQIIALTFTTSTPVATTAPAAPPAATPAPVPAVPPSPENVTLPTGSTLLVRMMGSVSSKNKAGTPFTTKLEYDLPAGGKMVKAGTVIYGKIQSSTQAGRVRGRSSLDLRLAQIIIGGQPVPITTSGHQQAGQASIAKAAKGAAAGAAIGAIAGDAGMGAAIGATAGGITKGQTITVAPGTLLEFTLTQPVVLRL